MPRREPGADGRRWCRWETRPGPPPAPEAPAGRAASRWPRRPPAPPPRSRHTGQRPSQPPVAQFPYGTVWNFHTVPYSHGGAEGKRPAAAHRDDWITAALAAIADGGLAAVGVEPL